MTSGISIHEEENLNSKFRVTINRLRELNTELAILAGEQKNEWAYRIHSAISQCMEDIDECTYTYSY